MKKMHFSHCFPVSVGLEKLQQAQLCEVSIFTPTPFLVGCVATLGPQSRDSRSKASGLEWVIVTGLGGFGLTFCPPFTFVDFLRPYLHF